MDPEKNEYLHFLTEATQVLLNALDSSIAAVWTPVDYCDNLLIFTPSHTNIFE